MKEEQNRKFTRIHFSREATLSFQEKRYSSCRIKDLCLGGMYVQGKFKEDIGETCQINLIQPKPASDSILEAEAKVIRADTEGLAFEFTLMTFDSYMFLQTTLLCEAEDPLSLCLEFPPHSPLTLKRLQANCKE